MSKTTPAILDYEIYGACPPPDSLRPSFVTLGVSESQGCQNLATHLCLIKLDFTANNINTQEVYSQGLEVFRLASIAI